MLILFAILFGGIFSGRLLRRYPLRALGRILTIDIWLLLLVLGLEVGGNERIIAGAASLGIQALLLCCGAVAGSIAAARLLLQEDPGAVGAIHSLCIPISLVFTLLALFLL